MATISAVCIHTIFRFTADVSNLASNAVESSEIKLSNLNWKVKLQKASIGDNSKEVLGVSLVAEIDDKTMDWSCEAQTTFKLLRTDGKLDQSIVKYLPKRKFSNEEPSHGFDEFIDWNEFLEQFVDRNKAIFNVEISAEPSIRSRGLDIDRNYAKYRVMIEHIDELSNPGSFSPETIVRGIRWTINARKNGDKCSLYLYADERDMDMNWFYEVDATFRLLPFDEDDQPIERSFTRKFCHGMSSRGFSEFVTWAKFVDKRYTQGHRAIIEVELKMKDAEPRWKISDYKLSKENSLLLCIICLECFSSGNIFSTKCGHLFCKPCFDKTLEQRKTCPNCNAPTSADELHPIFFA